MAIVRPCAMAIVRNAVLTKERSGSPKEILDSPQTVAMPNCLLQYAIVSKHSKAAAGLAPTVATRPSAITSSLTNPCRSASWKIVCTMSLFSSGVFGSPSSDNGSRINSQRSLSLHKWLPSSSVFHRSRSYPYLHPGQKRRLLLVPSPSSGQAPGFLP